MITLINKIFCAAFVFEYVFIFLLKKEKHKNYSSVRKIYSTGCKGIGGHKKKETNSKSETTTMKYFDNLKKNAT